jgi:hypothetical protein
LSCATHSLNKVVLPKPGGAERSVSGRVKPSFKRATSLGRATKCERPDGKYNFVRSKLWATAPSNFYPKNNHAGEERVNSHRRLGNKIHLSLYTKIICPSSGDYNLQDTTFVYSHRHHGDVILVASFKTKSKENRPINNQNGLLMGCIHAVFVRLAPSKVTKVLTSKGIEIT